MPVFVSYSHKDKHFAVRLAANLVRAKANVWLDDWEITAGESLIERIQEGIQGASVMLAVFSKNSVESIWCKKEVTAGIQRELEERHVLVVPVLLEDCNLPIFLRDKRYADFRLDFDEGLNVVLESIAKFTNASLGRTDTPEYHTDWSVDWGIIDGTVVLEVTLVQHSERLPHSVLSRIHIFGSDEATRRFKAYVDEGFEDVGKLIIAECIDVGLDGKDFFMLLEDEKAKDKEINIVDPNSGIAYRLLMVSRRLGPDNGRDILVHGADELRKIKQFMSEVVRRPTKEELSRLMRIVNRSMESA